jgi:hypothetical protein
MATETATESLTVMVLGKLSELVQLKVTEKSTATAVVWAGVKATDRPRA